MANFKKQKFYISEANRDGSFKRTRQVEGEILDIKGIKIGISKDKSGYTATEISTGMAVVKEKKTRKDAVAGVESMADKLKKVLEDPKFDVLKDKIRNANAPVTAVANEPAKEEKVPVQDKPKAKNDRPAKATKKIEAKANEKEEEKDMAEVKSVVVEMQVGKVTKNMVRFEEVLESEFVSPKIGTCYIPKGTLGELGYEESDGLEVVIRVIKKAK